jgi:hypothetical protein
MIMKKLTALLSCGILAFVGCNVSEKIKINSSEIKKNNDLGIPVRFEDYKTKGKIISEGMVDFGGQLVYLINYDLNNDRKEDVGELYVVKNPFIDERINPSMYAFDLNENNLVEDGEILIDINADGLNGNEEWNTKVNEIEGTII